MPYTAEHKAHTRARIVAAARQLFNRRGFAEVSIDEIMAAANLTRGGFYNHFSGKDELYAEAVSHILTCQLDGPVRSPTAPGAAGLVTEYLSDRRLKDVEDSCPLIAYPSDVAHAGVAVKRAYRQVLCALIGMLQAELGDSEDAHARAVTMATLCVGAMTLARAIDDPKLSAEIRANALAQALAVGGLNVDGRESQNRQAA